MNIIDGDGHIVERVGGTAGVLDFVAEPYRTARGSLPIFPDLDHLHNEPVSWLEGAGVGKAVGPAEWSAFLDEVGIEASVLYPTMGLAIGLMNNLDWAIVASRAYNDWLHAIYMQAHPRLHGMAVLPMQDPEAAADELRRAVTELGMRGGVLPSVGLKSPLGAKEYWPVYAEAERLGCALSVHGASGLRLGFDYISTRPAAHAISHPFGLLINLSSMVFTGVFDRFPGLRVAFLEGGVAWFLVAWERFDRSWATHVPFNPRNELLVLDEGQTVADYLARLADDGRLVIGCEGEEPDLARGIELVGSGAFMFSSDYPHEVSAQMCKEEVADIREHEALTDAQKADLLGRTAGRFYGLTEDGATA